MVVLIAIHISTLRSGCAASFLRRRTLGTSSLRRLQIHFFMSSMSMADGNPNISQGIVVYCQLSLEQGLQMAEGREVGQAAV